MGDHRLTSVQTLEFHGPVVRYGEVAGRDDERAVAAIGKDHAGVRVLSERGR